MRASAAFALAFVTASFVAGCAPTRPGLPARNLVLVTFDGLRADQLSCYSHPLPSSLLPTDPIERAEGRAFGLDELARAGVVFADAYAPSALTLPSLATLFTGLPPVATGVLDDRSRLPLDQPTLAELARDAGFETAAFVSHPKLDLLSAVGRGFETSHWFRSDGEALGAAREWMARDFGDARPVFLWIHLSGLEPPWEAIGKSEIGRREMEPLRFLDPGYQGPVDASPGFFERVAKGELQLAPQDRAAFAQLYDGRIAAVAGRMTSFLQSAFDYNRRGAESTEFWSRTLLVLTATHGFDLGQRGSRVAAEMRDDFLRVPLILRHPDSLTGERVLRPVVELSDVLPTLVELFDLPRPRVLWGRSLLSLTDVRPAQGFVERSAVTQSAERIFSARDGRWRLVWSPYRSRMAEGDPHRELPAVALYDRSLGMPEGDVAALHPEVVERLQAQIKDWITRQAFRVPLPLESRRSPETPGG
ncbi:MAG: sulfatase-like hydrolase/transferase [Planctomycetes bacterium]|nr:sulfatase-like hydrolase/transferase [Planctomycetota bacterium]